ncbi:flagellar motor switch protein FliM [Silvanigrella paludirubra]|uniref:Flagellar motor switch protein FliM n=1 Tax=Silvanigrella paludirubra TaxID=2499159 RepID=A0A6N6VPJ0_9BACT|nr:flagellar motor switch protein FliM [Silvanigrella paludirubra]KAB8036218.1 flagellar motor switch protein FliM [Silvanigrella paludirubra]
MDQVLSQNEVDALLNAVSDGRVEGPEGGGKGDASGIVHYDLANQDRIIRGRMPTLDIIHDRFIRLFRISLSAALRKVANIGVNSSGPIKFGEFMNSLPLPSCLNILRIEPLRGSAVMVIESKLLYALVDSLFGGSDVPYTKIEGKDFTQIEIKVARRIVMSAVDDLEKAWAPVFPLRITYSRTEINPQFVAIVPPSDVVISTAFDVELEKMSGSIKLVFPYSTLEPIKSKLSVGFQNEQLEVDHIWINRIKTQLMGTSVNLICNMGHCWINLRDLMELNKGDVLILDRDADKALDIVVEGIHKFRGVPGIIRGNKAIKITEIIGDY